MTRETGQLMVSTESGKVDYVNRDIDLVDVVDFVDEGTAKSTTSTASTTSTPEGSGYSFLPLA
jgi:hypothetical protein